MLHCQLPHQYSYYSSINDPKRRVKGQHREHLEPENMIALNTSNSSASRIVRDTLWSKLGLLGLDGNCENNDNSMLSSFNFKASWRDIGSSWKVGNHMQL